MGKAMLGPEGRGEGRGGLKGIMLMMRLYSHSSTIACIVQQWRPRSHSVHGEFIFLFLSRAC